MRAAAAIAGGMIKELIRRKDFYVLFMFLLILLGVLASQTFFQLEGISRYVRDFGYSMVMFFSFVIALTFSAKQLPAEIESRTIYPLLAKPLSRHTVIAGKFLGGVAVSIIAFSVFYVLFGLFCFTGEGAGGTALLAQGYFFGALFLCMVTALSLFLSNFLTMSANVTLTFLIYIMISGFGEQFREMVLYTSGWKTGFYNILYYLLPHLEFYDLRVRITHGWDPLPLWIVLAVTVYTMIYCFALLYLAGFVFRRRKL